MGINLSRRDENPLCLGIGFVGVGISALHRHIAEADGGQHHGKFVSVRCGSLRAGFTPWTSGR